MIGPAILLSSLFATILTFSCSFFISCLFYLPLQLIDEMGIYQTLFIEGGNASSCMFNTSELMDFTNTVNKSTYTEILSDHADRLMYTLLAVLGAYIVTLIVAQSLWTSTIFRLMNRLRIGFFNELLNKEMSWYDIHPSTELTPLITE